jgi:hypothetical protein
MTTKMNSIPMIQTGQALMESTKPFCSNLIWRSKAGEKNANSLLGHNSREDLNGGQ